MKRCPTILVLALMLVPALVHGGVVIKAKNYVRRPPAVYQCPLTLNFFTDITSDGAGDVKYAWVRSDGVRTPEVIVHFDRAEAKRVYYDWTLTVWNAVEAMQRVRVEVVSPNHFNSNWAGACVHCRPR